MESCLLKSPGFISFGGGLKRRGQIIETTVYYFTVTVLNLINQIRFLCQLMHRVSTLSNSILNKGRQKHGRSTTSEPKFLTWLRTTIRPGLPCYI